jgi:hypothetical protein
VNLRRERKNVSAEVSGKVLCRHLQETDHDAREDNEVDDLLFARR